MFDSLDLPTRHLINCLLSGHPDHPTAADHEALARHPQGKALASWLMTLPPYLRAEADLIAPDLDDNEEEARQ